jgi:hypothetical protein
MVEHREAWGRQLRESTDQIMGGKIALALDRNPELASQVNKAVQGAVANVGWN